MNGTNVSIKNFGNTIKKIQCPNGRIRPIIYRKLYKDLNYEYLDKHFKHYLITGEESWAYIDRKYWFKVPLTVPADYSQEDLIKHRACLDCQNQDTCPECLHETSWWDIRTLLVHITQCLNSSNMGNSYPQFPNDPFTRMPIPYQVLSQIFYRARELQMHLHCSTLAFLYTVDGKKDQLCETEANLSKRNHGNNRYNIRKTRKYLDSDELNDILHIWLRFRNINSQDSQGNFIGIWEPKYSTLNQFERSYRQYCQHPPYIFEFGQEIANPRRKLLENLLHQLPREEWNYELDTYPADTNPCQFHPKGLKIH
jgi:hypothetical protein